jgi:hypothetical protein
MFGVAVARKYNNAVDAASIWKSSERTVMSEQVDLPYRAEKLRS